MTTIMDAISEHARERPDVLAFWSPARTWTFADLEDASDRAAQGLVSRGFGPGDRVACLTKHTAQCVVLTLAANKIGAVCMPVNWRLAPPEIEYIVSNGQARLMMADLPFLPALREIDAPTIEVTVATEVESRAGPDSGIDSGPGFSDWLGGFDPLTSRFKPEDSDTALQLYSSGTTGLPKGVELTHANLAAGILGAVPLAVGYGGAPDVMLNVLPTYHIAGVGIGLLTAAMGGYSVLYPDFEPQAVIESIPLHRITHAFLVPAMIQFLLEARGVESGDYSTLKVISYGASPITEPVLVAGMRTFRCDFVQVYGLTETSGAVTVLPPEDHDPEGPRKHLLRSAGKAIAGVEIRVVDPESGRDCADDGVGEVWLRTRQNMKGYWADPDATDDAFVDRDASGFGWFRTGDAGYLRDGYVYMHDRIKDMVVSGGENIYPAEVENALMQHPAIADAAVIGVPDDRWGESVMACVVLRHDAAANEKEITAFLRERIAHFKCPRRFSFLEEIPRNPTGKILKRVLRKPYWDGDERQIN